MTAKLLTVKQVAEQLNISQQAVRELINTGQLRAYRLGNKHQTTQEWIEECLKRQEVQVQK